MSTNNAKKVANWDEEVTDVVPKKVDSWDEEVSDEPVKKKASSEVTSGVPTLLKPPTKESTLQSEQGGLDFSQTPSEILAKETPKEVETPKPSVNKNKFEPTIADVNKKITEITLKQKYPEYGEFKSFAEASKQAISEEQKQAQLDAENRSKERRLKTIPAELQELREEKKELLLKKDYPSMKKLQALDAVERRYEKLLKENEPKSYADISNLNKDVIKGMEDEVHQYINLPENKYIKEKIALRGLTDIETNEILLAATEQKTKPIIADIKQLTNEGIVDIAKQRMEMSKSINAKQDELKNILLEIDKIEESELDKKGFKELNVQINKERGNLDKLKPLLAPIEGNAKLIAKERAQIETEIKQFDSKINGNQWLGTEQELKKYKQLFSDYNVLLSKEKEIENSPELISYNKQIGVLNSLLETKKGLVKGLEGTKHPELVAKYDLIRNDINNIITKYQETDSPEINQKLNQFYTLTNQLDKATEKYEGARGRLVSLDELDRAKKEIENDPNYATDFGARALNSIADFGKGLAAFPFSFAASLHSDGGYHYSDAVSDLIQGKGMEKGFLINKNESLINPETGKANWGVIPIINSIGDNLGTLLGFATTGRYLTPIVAGEVAGASSTIMEAQKATEIAKAYTTIVPAYMSSYSGALDEAKELGFQGKGAFLYANAIGFLNGVSEMILPDQDLVFGKGVKTKMLKEFIENYAKNPTTAVKDLTTQFVKNGLGGASEEWIVMLGETAASSLGHLADSDIKAKIPTIDEIATTGVSSFVLEGGMGMIGQYSENKTLNRLGKLEFAKDFENGKLILDGLKERGAITDDKYNKLVSDIQKYQSVIGQVPDGISDFKKIAIIEKMLDIKAIKENLPKEKSEVFEKIANKKINEIQTQIEAIIDDKDFDKNEEKKFRSEIEKMVQMANESAKSRPAKEIELQRFTSPTEDNYGTINRNDGKGIVTLTKEEYLNEVESKISNLEKSIDNIDNEQSKAVVYEQVNELNKEKAEILKREIKQENEIRSTDNNIPQQVESPPQEIKLTPIEVIAGKEQGDGGVAKVVQGDGQVKLEEPSAEQQFEDVKNGNVVTFEYKNESEVPEVFKDKISSSGEINGKKSVKVTMAKSLADFYLQKTPNLPKEKVVGENVEVVTPKEIVKEESPVFEEKNKTNEAENLFKNTEENKKHNALKEILKKAQIPFDLNVSYKNGSHYWTIDGVGYRVADHAKPKGSFGYETYKSGDGDFRSYDDFYDFLSKEIDLTDKSEAESNYKKEASKFIEKIDDTTFKQPDGTLFGTMEGALNNMWMLKKEIPSQQQLQTPKIETNDKENKSGVQSNLGKRKEPKQAESNKVGSQENINAKVEQVDRQGELALKTKEEIVAEVELKKQEAESKIKRRDLFDGVGEFSTELGGSDKAAVPISHKEKSGIEFVEYAHPETGSVDVIVTGKSDNDFVGFYRIYENGKPTNKWSSKFENQSRNKEDFKTMISGVQEMLPQGHEYTEKSSISTDGLRVWEQQLSRGYELQYDENGKLKTNLVAINGDAIVNELGIPVEKGQFENIKVKSKEEFEIVKKALLPYLEKLGLGENDVMWLTGTVKINLPILKQTKQYEKEPTKKEDGKPLSGGVQGVRIEGKGRKESAELRAEEEALDTRNAKEIGDIQINDINIGNVVIGYHATPTGEIGTGKELGIHIGTEDVSNNIKKGRNADKGDVKKVAFRVNKPLILGDMPSWSSVNVLNEMMRLNLLGIDKEKIREIRDSDLSEKEKQQRAIELAKENGYDSFAYQNFDEGNGEFSYVLFDDSKLNDITPKEAKATPQEGSVVGASLRDVELKMRRPEKNEVIFVSVDALLQKHAADQPSYDVQKEGNRIKGRVEKAKEFIKNYIKDQRAINPKTGERMNTKVSFEPSVVDIDANGKISFEDGRHRVLAAKEMGLTEVPIEVPKERVKAVEQSLKETPKAGSVVGGEVNFTEVEDKKIKDIATEANLKVGSYVRSVPTGKKNKFGNSINEYEATNPFTNEKITFKKQGDATDYVVKEIAKATTKSGREEIFKAVEQSLKETPQEVKVSTPEKVQEEAKALTKEEIQAEEEQDEMLLSGESDKRRRQGKFTKDGITYVRQKETEGIEGSQDEVVFAKGVTKKFKYKVIDRSQLQPSHLGGLRNSMHFIPEAQPKRRTDSGSIAAEQTIANNPNLKIAGENTNAYSGAPVVNKRGEVIQGNNRAAGLVKAYKQGTASNYKQDLINNAEKYGMTKEQVEAMEEPVLVRELDVNDTESIELGNYEFNDIETGNVGTINPVKIVSRMTKKIKEALVREAFKGEYGTTNESIRGNFDAIEELLVRYLNVSQYQALRDSNKNPSTKGIEAVNTLLQRLVFDGGDVALSDMFEGLPPSKQNTILKAAVSIISLPTDITLLQEFQNAIVGFSNFVSRGTKSVDAWSKEYDAFTNSSPRDIYTPLELEMIRLLSEKPQSEFSKMFKDYSVLVKGKKAEGMWGEDVAPITKAEAVENIFKIKQDEQQSKESGTGSSKKVSGEKAEQEQPQTPTEKAIDVYKRLSENNDTSTRKEYKALPESIKRVLDNIVNIHQQLEQKKIITKKGNCP